MYIVHMCFFLQRLICLHVCAAMDSVNSLQLQLNEDRFSTPVKKASVPLFVSILLPLPTVLFGSVFIHCGAYRFIVYVEVFVFYT